MKGRFKTGDRVRIRSLAEILDTLDEQGRLEGLPFMAEMVSFCGQEMLVSKTAHKTCDTVNQTGGRSLPGTVHLADLRCDGANHGGCDADCLLFWKEAWLEPAGNALETGADCRIADQDTAWLNTAAIVAPNVYRCQATLLPEYTELLPWWDVRQYVADVRGGNEALSTVIKSGLLKMVQNCLGKGVAFGILTTVYERMRSWFGAHRLSWASPALARGAKTPTEKLDLQPGEIVRVKDYDEILETLDADGKNRGMRFDIEMQPFCGQRFRVRKRVDRILVEQTGELFQMKSPSVILDGVVCRSKYSDCRMYCPRQIPSFWREIWLERVPAQSGDLIAAGEAESG